MNEQVFGQNDDFLWVEKYRPQRLDDCILSEQKRKVFQNYLKSGELQNLIFSGGPGRGKTLLARVLCNELGITPLFINASDENGIDVLRAKIKEFASTVSIGSEVKHKVVILDEGESLTPNAQFAFRGISEQFSNNCRFIFTCNYRNKIIPALAESRFIDIEFSDKEYGSPDILKQMYDRAIFILKNEGIPFEKEVVRELVIRFGPDLRRVINQLQRYSLQHGSIDTGLLSNDSDSLSASIDLATLVEAIKKKSFKSMRRWVIENNAVNEPADVFRALYDEMYNFLEPASIPQLVLLIAEYQYKAAFVTDQEINLVAFLTEVMAQCQMKN